MAADLLTTLRQVHQALGDLGSRIQNDRGVWKVRHPHEDMPGVIDRCNAAMEAAHACYVASAPPLAAPATTTGEDRTDLLRQALDALRLCGRLLTSMEPLTHGKRERLDAAIDAVAAAVPDEPLSSAGVLRIADEIRATPPAAPADLSEYDELCDKIAEITAGLVVDDGDEPESPTINDRIAFLRKLVEQHSATPPAAPAAVTDAMVEAAWRSLGSAKDDVQINDFDMRELIAAALAAAASAGMGE